MSKMVHQATMESAERLVWRASLLAYPLVNWSHFSSWLLGLLVLTSAAVCGVSAYSELYPAGHPQAVNGLKIICGTMHSVMILITMGLLHKHAAAALGIYSMVASAFVATCGLIFVISHDASYRAVTNPSNGSSVSMSSSTTDGML